jgi:hypothetical protein
MPTSTVSMGVEFFHAEEPASEQLQEAIMNLAGKALAEREYELREEQVVRLEEAHYGWQHCVEGEMARLRFNALPEKGARGRRLESLGLPANAGVGDRCAFLYDTKSHTLLMQRNWLAISVGGFAHYLNAQAQLADKLELRAVLTEEGYKKLASMTDIRRLEIALAAPKNPGNILEGSSSAVRPILNARDALLAPSAKFVFASGRGGESLPKRIVTETVRDFLRMREDDEKSVKSIKVVGGAEDEEPTLLDLISEKLKDSDELEPSRERSLPYDRRKASLRQVWHRHRAELHRMFT